MIFVDNIGAYVERYRTFDEPVPYKDIFVYPVKVRDYYRFTSSLDVLTIEKNKIPDVKIIQMSYLLFLLQIIIEDVKFKDKFINILDLCFRPKKSSEYYNEKFTVGELLYGQIGEDELYFINGYDVNFVKRGNNVTLVINGCVITAIEFNELIDIIQFQNIPDYDNEKMSDDFKALMEEYYKLRNKNIKPPTLEEQLIAIMGQNGMSKKELLDETIYTIKGMLDSIMGKVDYEVQHLYRSHAMTDKKLPDIEHWVIKSKKDKYADLFTNLDKYKQQFEAN